MSFHLVILFFNCLTWLFSHWPDFRTAEPLAPAVTTAPAVQAEATVTVAPVTETEPAKAVPEEQPAQTAAQPTPEVKTADVAVASSESPVAPEVAKAR